MSITIKYDFVSPNSDILNDINIILSLCKVEPLSINIDYVSQYDNVTVEFVNQGDAILFGQVYLGSENPSDLEPYVGSDTPLAEAYGG